MAFEEDVLGAYWCNVSGARKPQYIERGKAGGKAQGLALAKGKPAMKPVASSLLLPKRFAGFPGTRRVSGSRFAPRGADDPKDIERAAMIIRAYGHSTTETLVATPWKEFLAML